MATRFGASTPGQKYAARSRWLVFGLLGVIILLLVLLVVNSGGPSVEPAANPAVASTPVVETPNSSTVEILLVSQRIEEGAALADYMLKSAPWDIEAVPPDVVFARERQAIVGKFAKVRLDPNTPLLKEYVVDTPPVSLINIPPGYRAVTITVDSRSGVQGFARPNSRVDVLWTYTEKNQRKRVTTIVPFAKVLSVSGGVGDPNAKKEQVVGPANVTLLVTIQQAKKIELARTLGTLSLALIGDVTTGQEEGDLGEVQLTDLIPEKAVDKVEARPDGTMIIDDPVTGKKVRYILVDGRWKPDDSAPSY
jgi:pilus assembly protein CpaB